MPRVSVVERIVANWPVHSLPELGQVDWVLDLGCPNEMHANQTVERATPSVIVVETIAVAMHAVLRGN